MSNIWILKGQDTSELSLKVIGYENEKADDIDDANWLQSIITLKAPNKHLQLPANCQTHDIAEFYDEFLMAFESFSGSVEFYTTEENLRFSLSFESDNEVYLEGRLLDLDKPPGINFSFMMDKEMVSESLNQLKDLVEAFPVKVGA